MKERPILFSGPMVRAILEGRKTQTRRAITKENIRFWSGGLDYPGKFEKADNELLEHMLCDALDFRLIDGVWVWSAKAFDYQAPATRTQWMGKCQYGQPGDRLWVRENGWERPDRTPRMMRHGAGTWEPYYFDADGLTEDERDQLKRWGFKRRPSIHMPRWASRITLGITDVRVERLQEISGADAKAEGVSIPAHVPQDGADMDWALREFRKLWQSINDAGSWEKNPWVWAIEFRRVDRAQ